MTNRYLYYFFLLSPGKSLEQMHICNKNIAIIYLSLKSIYPYIVSIYVKKDPSNFIPTRLSND